MVQILKNKKVKVIICLFQVLSNRLGNKWSRRLKILSTMLCFLLLISYLLSFSLLSLQWHILITENKDSLIGQHQQYCLRV